LPLREQNLLIAMCMETEIRVFMKQYEEITNPEGKAVMVRNGYMPDRKITTSGRAQQLEQKGSQPFLVLISLG